MSKKIYEYESFQQYKDENTDTFKNHSVRYINLGLKNDCMIIFENPNCSEGAMKFVYIDGVLTVQGDYGTASFNWHNPNNHILVYGTFNSFGYILSKIESIPKEGIKEFNSDLFQEEFVEFINEKLEYGYDLIGLDFNQNQVENHCHVVELMNENYELFGGDLEAEDYELGMYTTERPYVWWQGLQTALDMLEKEGTFRWVIDSKKQSK